MYEDVLLGVYHIHSHDGPRWINHEITKAIRMLNGVSRIQSGVLQCCINVLVGGLVHVIL